MNRSIISRKSLIDSRWKVRDGHASVLQGEEPRERSRLTTFLAALSLLLAGANANAASLLVDIHLTRTAEHGTDEFSLEVPASTGTTYYAPDGTVFTKSQRTVSGLTFADVISRFANRWTIVDGFNLPAGAPEQRHYFSLSPTLQLSDFRPYSTFISPSDGGIVPSTFQVNWRGGGSLEVYGTPYTYKQTPTGVTLTVKPFGNPSRVAVTLNVVQWNNQAPKVVSDTLKPQNTYAVDLKIRSAVSRTVQAIVPEPTSMRMAWPVFFGLAAVRRRK
ncbi:hypothetical protein [Lacipirellula sp.]|uniref:hypothetical protein n=1 Tax=Lacipirellula sp. TaxID=2691419 RepID=UPI003D1329DA